MTQTHLEAVNASKTEHATRIIVALEAVHDLILSEPEIWFPEPAPKLMNIAAMEMFYAKELRALFGLETPPEA